METSLNYKNDLTITCNNLLNSYKEKINFISSLKSFYYINKLVKIGIKNKKEDEVLKYIGILKMQYKKYCKNNRFIPAPEVNNKFKKAYIKLSRRTLKNKTTKKYVNNSSNKVNIEYNSETASYFVDTYKNNERIAHKEYKLRDIKNIDKKRKSALNLLKRMNYGINIFDELKVDENNMYRLNPHIINILIKENRLDLAKIYIKQVAGRERCYSNLNIQYKLNKDLNTGIFSKKENMNMKKMAKYDRISSKIIIIGKKKTKTISPLEENIGRAHERAKRKILNRNEIEDTSKYDLSNSLNTQEFYNRVRIKEKQYLLNKYLKENNHYKKSIQKPVYMVR